MAKPDPQASIRNSQSEISSVIAAAQALQIDAPIIAYRILGNRIELWTIHGGPYVYTPPFQMEDQEGSCKKLPRKKKQ